jgi:hypothetical protein
MLSAEEESRELFQHLTREQIILYRAEGYFGLACVDAIVHSNAALGNLRAALEISPMLRNRARVDSDLKPLRDAPESKAEFEALVS